MVAPAHQERALKVAEAVATAFAGSGGVSCQPALVVQCFEEVYKKVCELLGQTKP